MRNTKPEELVEIEEMSDSSEHDEVLQDVGGTSGERRSRSNDSRLSQNLNEFTGHNFAIDQINELDEESASDGSLQDGQIQNIFGGEITP